ncbi:hypothetical protein ABZW32_36685 [Streptomyces sp. NPDC004667]|uniref:hypothetical protein n=1 Tax=Streptomyces sp. NPDC004667 TaxID=3154285 RepID=UPI0033A4F30D
MTWPTFRRLKPHDAQDFPSPVSSEGALVLLWDLEQVEAYRSGRPQPALPAREDDEDLLDRREAALALNVKPRSIDSYKTDSRLADHAVVVAGAEHWPRGVLRAYGAARGTMAAPSGRPIGSGDMVPRDLLPGRIAALLDADPAVTAAHAVDVLGIATSTAQRHLQQERAARIATRMRTEDIDAEEAADRLGYPPALRRIAVKAAQGLYDNH